MMHENNAVTVDTPGGGAWHRCRGRCGVFYALALVVALLSSCVAPGRCVYRGDGFGDFAGEKHLASCLPLQAISTEYLNNTDIAPDTQLSDSFLIEAVNALLYFELDRYFQMTGIPAGPVRPDCRYSILNGDTLHAASAAERVRHLARETGAGLVIVPYACSVRYVISRPAGWRHDKYGDTYARPVSYRALTRMHVQIWSAKGDLLFERIGKSDTGRPVFYSWFKKEKPGEKDVVRFSRSFYAPPIVRSLRRSIDHALILR